MMLSHVIFYLVLFAICLVISGTIVITKALHLKHTSREEDGSAVQSAHITPTPRIGSIGVIVTIAAGFLFITAPELHGLLIILLLSFLPVFTAGLLEDFGYRINPTGRLLASFLSSMTFIILTGVHLLHMGIIGTDAAMQYVPFAIIVTTVIMAGIVNAFNLIDGLNGLMAGIGTISALALAYIASQAGKPHLAEVILILVPALIGFLVFNFPFGCIFMGDAGAYSIGFFLACFANILVFQTKTIAPPAILLIFFWPVADTLLAIYRRKKTGNRIDAPDRLHFHQLIMRFLEATLFSKKQRNTTNPLAAFITLIFAALPIGFGAWSWNNLTMAWIGVLGFSGLFIVTYVVIIRVVRRRKLVGLMAVYASSWRSKIGVNIELQNVS